ncbi:hypothetical protein RHSIM_RhsimMtG0003000 (mitochondrion) [Rhododendron simsii]|uniref:Mitochondrial protein n=1 Tax=Rhododendron simsii TaxID=118357 RepID=A0A834FXK7_RHOSS|nr:hypothetical protein RHSIM_RhsimMtG0003000 [Rhododendron simsii]
MKKPCCWDLQIDELVYKKLACVFPAWLCLSIPCFPFWYGWLSVPCLKRVRFLAFLKGSHKQTGLPSRATSLKKLVFLAFQFKSYSLRELPVQVQVNHEGEDLTSPPPGGVGSTFPHHLERGENRDASWFRRSTRISKPPDRYGVSSLFTTLETVSIPTSYKQAVKDECWRSAMAEELLALEANRTWDLVLMELSLVVNGSTQLR